MVKEITTKVSKSHKERIMVSWTTTDMLIIWVVTGCWILPVVTYHWFCCFWLRPLNWLLLTTGYQSHETGFKTGLWKCVLDGLTAAAGSTDHDHLRQQPK